MVEKNDEIESDDGDDLEKTLPSIEKTTPMLDKTISDGLDATVMFPVPHDQTIPHGPSILTSGNVGATINPRDLGPAEAEEWQSIVGVPHLGGAGPDEIRTLEQVADESTVDDDVTVANLTQPSATRVVRGKGSPSGDVTDQTARNFGTRVAGQHIKQNRQVSGANLTQPTPAIERTVSDNVLGRLRTCDVVDARANPKPTSDYQLVKKLGQGGMGDVFVARQKSLDRLLALKLIKPIEGERKKRLEENGRLKEFESERRHQFLSEAEVTGNLDHPNIVPIHDVAVTNNGELFYSMKKVDGIPWSEKIKVYDVAHNIEVLLKVCDAIAFAHDRGVVHRDIKPENIMLGEFGVVMVMDWGLALPTSTYPKERQESILATSGLGGTPAFMSPEMATGPLTQIGPPSDIYLLGATLFMIISGAPPHSAANVTECLKMVRSNTIREVPADKHGELLDIAIKAMATNPNDRYASVLEFQQAIRDYLDHADSIRRSREARLLLTEARESGSYENFSRASFKFQEAIESWLGNQDAIQGLAEARLAYAESAYSKGDFDLGFSLVDDQNESHAPIIKKLKEGVWLRESRITRLKLLRRVAAAMLVFILVGGTLSWLKIRSEMQNAITARDQAEVAKVAALDARDREQEAKQQAMIAQREAEKSERAARMSAEQERLAKVEAEKSEQSARMSAEQEKLAKVEAVKQKELAEMFATSEKQAREIADQEKQRAIEAKALAEISERRASYEEYISKIALAKASLERNESANARKILDSLRTSPHSQGWEWRWLWKQTSGAESEYNSQSGIQSSSNSPDGRTLAAIDDNGHVFLLQAAMSTHDPVQKQKISIPVDLVGHATCVALPNRSAVCAIGFDDGSILVSIDGKQKTFRSHTGRVNDLHWLGDDLLISGSSDRTVRIFDVQSGTEKTNDKALWHLSPVGYVAAARKGNQVTIAAAMSTETAGRVMVWDVELASSIKFEERGTFAGHRRPISSLAIRDDGILAASGDIDGGLLLWNPQELSQTNYEQSVKRAVDAVDQNTQTMSPADRDQAPKGIRLEDLQLKSAGSELAHRDTIQTLDFDDSGEQLISGSDDFTMKSWDVAKRSLRTMYRGHGAWVTSAAFHLGDADRIVSVSSDGKILQWNAKTYVSDSVSQTLRNPSQGKGNVSALTKPAHGFSITSAAFAPDGRRIVTASIDHTAKILSIDPKTLAFGDEIDLEDQSLHEGTSFVAMSMQTDRESKTLFIGSADATVRVWDVARGIQRSEIQGTGLNGAIAVSPSGKLLLTGSSSPDFKTILWRVDPQGTSSTKRLARMAGHDQAVTAMDISADESKLFTIDSIGYGILWEASTGKALGRPIENTRGSRPSTANFSASGNAIWIGGDNGLLAEIDLQSRQTMRKLNHEGGVRDVSFDARYRYVVTVSELVTLTQRTSVATLWNLQTGKSVELDRAVAAVDREENRSQRIIAARLSGDASTVVVSRREGSGQSTLSIWRDLDSIVAGTKASRTLGLPKQLQTTQSLILPNNEHCITMNKNGAFQWELTSGKLLRSYREHGALTRACFSTDGKYVATGSRSVKIWDAANGKAVAKIETPHLGPVRTFTFLPTASEKKSQVYDLVTGGDDGVARQWSIDAQAGTTQPVRQWPVSNQGAVRVVTASVSGNLLLIAGEKGVARVIDTRDPDRDWKFDIETTADGRITDFTCGAFSEDERFIAMGGSDHLVRMYAVIPDDSEVDESIRNLASNPIVFSGHASNVDDVRVIGNVDSGLRVFSASSDDSARVWDSMIRRVDGKETVTSVEGREVLSLQKHRGDVTAIDVTRDGQLMMTAGRDGQVILWPATASP